MKPNLTSLTMQNKGFDHVFQYKHFKNIITTNIIINFTLNDNYIYHHTDSSKIHIIIISFTYNSISKPALF